MLVVVMSSSCTAVLYSGSPERESGDPRHDVIGLPRLFGHSGIVWLCMGGTYIANLMGLTLNRRLRVLGYQSRDLLVIQYQ